MGRGAFVSGTARARRGILAVVSVAALGAAMTLAMPRAGAAAGIWSIPDLIDGGHSLTSVSCVSSSFCVAVDNNGDSFVYNGISWSGGVIDLGGSLSSVSCVSSSFCVAVDWGGDALIYNGTSWSSSVIDAGGAVSSVSCVSRSFCIAVDQNNSAALLYNGISWFSIVIDPGHVLNSVSCVSTSFCVAVDGRGAAVVYNGINLSVSVIDTHLHTNSVSCASRSFCVAVDGSGNGIVDDGTGWSSSDIDTSNALSSVSCPTSSFCAAVDGVGNVLTYTGPAGTGPPGPGPGAYRLGGFQSPREGSAWRLGTVIKVSTTVTEADGMPIPATLAADISSNCDLTVAGTGLITLPRRCLRYNATTGRFTAHLPTRARRRSAHTGTEILTLNLTYPVQATAWDRIALIPAARSHHHKSRHRHRHRHRHTMHHG